MSGKDRMGGYTWWPSDYAMDEHVALMSYEQEGVYRKLLDYAWLHGSVPADLALMARLLGKGMTAKRLARLWPAIAPCWQEQDGRLTNGRLERERADLIAFRAERSAAGRRGAETTNSRWLRPGSADGSAAAQPRPPTPTPSPSPEGASKSLQHRGGDTPPKGGSRARTHKDELPGCDRPAHHSSPTPISDIIGRIAS